MDHGIYPKHWEHPFLVNLLSGSWGIWPVSPPRKWENQEWRSSKLLWQHYIMITGQWSWAKSRKLRECKSQWRHWVAWLLQVCLGVPAVHSPACSSRPCREHVLSKHKQGHNLNKALRKIHSAICFGKHQTKFKGTLYEITRLKKKFHFASGGESLHGVITFDNVAIRTVYFMKYSLANGKDTGGSEINCAFRCGTGLQ